MRRITEIPESVSRQCSREDKEGGDHSIPKSHTSKKNHQDSNAVNSKSKEDSTKHRPFSLKKSCSTYDHLRTQDDKPNGISPEKTDVSENSVRNSVNGKKLGHKEAEDLEAVSAESVPLVCKSASAHNLTLDKKPLHPSLSVLQKSLSAIANSKDKGLGLGEKTKSLEDTEKYKIIDSNDEEGQKAVSCPNKEEYIDQQQPKTSSPIEETEKSHKPGIMKQQAMSLTLGEADKAISALGFKDKFDIEEVCPWEMYDLTPTAVPSENKVQKHVSIAPLDSEKNHPSRSKSKSHSRSKTTEQGHHQSKQKNPGKSDLSTRDNQDQALKDNSSKKHQPGDNETADQEALMKKKASSSQDKEQRKNFPVIEGILPPLDGHINSNNNLPQPLGCRAEVCPWDFEPTDESGLKRGKSSPTSSGLSPSSPCRDMPTSPSKKKEMPAKKSAKKDENLEKDKGQKRASEKELDPKSSNVKMDKSKSAEVCSVAGDHTLAVPVSKGKSTSNQHGIDKCKLVEVCPWDNLSTSQSEQDTEATDSKHNNTMQTTNMVEICPWDYHGNDGK